MDWKEGNRVLIEPRKGRKEKSLPRTTCLISVPEDLDYILSCYANSFSSKRKIFTSDCYLYQNGYSDVAFVGPILGAPQAVLVLEKAIALGAHDFIFVGWCGSLQSYVEIGSLVIPISSVSEEGTSSHYPLVSFQDNSILYPLCFKKILDRLKDGPVSVHKGVVWSIDAPYRETVSKVLFYKQKGVLGVDMETSALMRVARYRRVNLGMILIVSDTLYTLKWKPGLKDPVFASTRKFLLKSMMDVLTEHSGA